MFLLVLVCVYFCCSHRDLAGLPRKTKRAAVGLEGERRGGRDVRWMR